MRPHARPPSGGAAPPHTRLRAVAGAYRIWWSHSAMGDGRLTVRHDGPARNLLEPWTGSGIRPAQLYRFVPLGGNRYRIRSHYGDSCLAVAGAGAGAVVRRAGCRGTSGEVFLVDVEGAARRG
ncbi:MAG TPA: hypothetical protein VFY17_01575 [Pilimelia sp.]|nr:hypothetical protein [Pilimelia sp.]